MTNTEIEQIAIRVLSPERGKYGLEHIEVRVDQDDSDEPALFVETFMKAGIEALGGTVASNAHHALSEELLRAGETRFPYFLVRYKDDEASNDPASEAH